MHFLNVLNLILISQQKRPGLLNSPIEFFALIISSRLCSKLQGRKNPLIDFFFVFILKCRTDWHQWESINSFWWTIRDLSRTQYQVT